jgi:hypothetical protein
MLCYFTFRGMIGSVEDLRWFLRAFVIMLIPYFVLVSIQWLTLSNPFVIVAGSEYENFMFRNGKPRCIGSFRHPDLLGTLGASFLPLYIGLAFAKKDRIRALVGIGLCLGIVYLTNSGGPVSAVAVAIVGWLLWPVRTKTSLVRRTIVASLLVVALVMKAPIWYLPAKVSSITGGGGWHRSYLLDVAFKHIDKWWLAGMPASKTGDWFPYSLENGAADITNQYIAFGISAGLGGIGLLILLLVKSFRSLGEALKSARSNDREIADTEIMLWGMGVMLVVHVINWFGISYFDQIYVVWFMQLASISGLSKWSRTK